VSIKDDVNYVKTELSSDEKVLESAFKLESLYKKYKTVIWGAGIIGLLYFVTITGMDALHRSKLEAANQALLTLQQKPDDAQALQVLQEKNPALYELHLFSKAADSEDVQTLSKIAQSKDTILADMSRYSKGAIEERPVDSKIYKELSYLEEAYIAIKAGNKEEAKRKLELIDARSAAATFARLLGHATLKAK
jgi:hypothetical protein